MKTHRLEAFSDGVLAIVITIMILELKVPEQTQFSALRPLIPKFISYVLSFIYVGIYWNNHHHIFQAIEKVNGKVLWANLFLLFWLSMIPFSTAWMGQNPFEQSPVAMYGIVLLFCAFAFLILEKASMHLEGENSALSRAVKQHNKEYLSLALYISGVAASFYWPVASIFLYGIVAILWLIPDKRIEKAIKE